MIRRTFCLAAVAAALVLFGSVPVRALCSSNAQCDDGVFCNGVEVCNTGICEGGADACPGKLCDEVTDTCLGAVAHQARMGDPLLGLTQPQRTRFDLGKIQFARVFNSAEGLGPVFNQHSCGSCHNVPLGGAGSIQVTRFGFVDEETEVFDPLDTLGGSLLQAQSISVACAESVPVEANVTALRTTNSILGFGLVEAIPDPDIQARATTPPPGVSGVVNTVTAFEAPLVPRVGRFGWKSQVPTVLTFSADASLMEMGITNRFVMTENDPNGVNAPSLGAPDNCDTIADPEDVPDFQGVEFIDRLTDFQRYLAAPPQTPKSGMAGEALFDSIGCANCHAAPFTTPSSPSLEPAIAGRTIKPYSDFLLHDMGLSADFIQQGAAGARELRTPPLWGVRVRDPLWHDGRVAGGTFSSRMDGAIAAHNTLLNEGQAAAQAYFGLSSTQQGQLVAFLDSLGRAEFDMDGDGDVDAADVLQFKLCRAGSGPYGADDPCAPADPDQDGFVDQDDFWLLLQSTSGGGAGVVPDGQSGPPLLVSKGPGSTLALSWGASCRATDMDYAVYQGTIGNFAVHSPLLCSTGMATTASVPIPPGSAYYLVVPSNGFREGSYGTNSFLQERPPGTAACFPKAVAACQ